MYELNIKNTELEKYKNFHKKFLPKRKKNFEMKTVHINDSIVILNDCVKILDKLRISNYELLKSKIEVHQRNCGFENKNVNHFDWHTDDYNVLPYKVYTIIFYLRKDLTVKGGNLLYRDHNNINVINVDKPKVVVFAGNIRHKPENIMGFGCRDIITVFIRKTK